MFQIPLQVVNTVILLKVSSLQAQAEITLMISLGLLSDKATEDIVQLSQGS